MAKVGYIFIATNGEEYAEDKAWMQQYGCVQVIEELSEHERLRPMWKQLISSLERGDELVVSRFSNALRGTRELATFIEYCRVKVVRIISIQDRIDTFDELFPDTKPSQVIRMFGSLSAGVCRAAQGIGTHHPSATEYPAAQEVGKGTVETGA